MPSIGDQGGEGWNLSKEVLAELDLIGKEGLTHHGSDYLQQRRGDSGQGDQGRDFQVDSKVCCSRKRNLSTYELPHPPTSRPRSTHCLPSQLSVDSPASLSICPPCPSTRCYQTSSPSRRQPGVGQLGRETCAQGCSWSS